MIIYHDNKKYIIQFLMCLLKLNYKLYGIIDIILYKMAQSRITKLDIELNDLKGQFIPGTDIEWASKIMNLQLNIKLNESLKEAYQLILNMEQTYEEFKKSMTNKFDKQTELIKKLENQIIENSRIKINDDNKLCIKNVALNKKSYIFKYNANESSDVYITGTFNNWEKIKMTNENNIWKYYIDLDEGTYEYKFIINDEWKHDEKQPIITNNGIINNIIIL